jgi:O-antigen/teichoic acid export membrane protein
MSSSGPATPSVVEELEAAGDLVDSPDAGPAALRGGLLSSGGYVVSILLSLVAAPLLIRHLGIADFGRYSTVVALVTIVGGLTDAGLVGIALREWSTHSGDDRRRIMGTLLGLRIQLSSAAVLVGVAFALIAGYSNAMVLGTLLAGAGMALQVIANLLTAALQGELRFGWSTIITVSRQVVVVILVVTLVLAGAGLLPFLAVTIPAGLVALLLTAFVVRDITPLRPTMRGPERWSLLKDTLPYAAAIALNSMYFRVTIVVMSLDATAQQTGYFATSFKVTEVLVGVPSLAIGAAFPIISRAARNNTERFAYATGRILELALIVGAFVVLLVVLSAPFVIDVLAGHAGAPAAPVLQIQGLSLVATFMSVATGYALLSLRHHSALLIGNAAALAANIVLSLSLIPIAQAKGAAYSAVIAESCLALGQLTLLLRHDEVRMNLGTVAAVAVAGVAGAAPLLLPGVHPVIRTVMGLAIYTAGLAVTRRLPPELTHLLRAKRRAPLR